MSFTGVCGVGVSDVYMLQSVGGTALWNTIFELALCGCFVSECGVWFAAFYVVCDEFDSGVWDVCLV